MSYAFLLVKERQGEEMNRAKIATNNMSIILGHFGMLDIAPQVKAEEEKYCYDCGCDLEDEEKERGICNKCWVEYEEERPEDVYGVDGLR